MKIALLLSIVCSALIVSGCGTERGGTTEEYNTTSGTQTGPPMTDPSLPGNPGAGPVIPPP